MSNPRPLLLAIGSHLDAWDHIKKSKIRPYLDQDHCQPFDQSSDQFWIVDQCTSSPIHCWEGCWPSDRMMDLFWIVRLCQKNSLLFSSPTDNQTQPSDLASNWFGLSDHAVDVGHHWSIWIGASLIVRSHVWHDLNISIVQKPSTHHEPGCRPHEFLWTASLTLWIERPVHQAP